MKKILILTVLSFAGIVAMQAQAFPNKSMWYDGLTQYVASVAGNNVHLVGGTPHEGGYELTLVRTKKKLKPASPLKVVAYYEVKERPELFAEHVAEGIVEALILREPAGRIISVLNRTQLSNYENMEYDISNVLSGTYSTMQVGFLGHGEEYVIDYSKCKMGKKAPLADSEFMQEYDMPVNVIKTKGKLWMLVPTIFGLNIYPASYDEDSDMYSRAGEAIPVYWSDHTKGRFSIASERVLNMSILSHYSKEALKLMRNEILARHGYIFKSDDLSTYFLKQDWYEPEEEDSRVELSAVEQLNISMIQSAESVPDSEWVTQMEE